MLSCSTEYLKLCLKVSLFVTILSYESETAEKTNDVELNCNANMNFRVSHTVISLSRILRINKFLNELIPYLITLLSMIFIASIFLKDQSMLANERMLFSQG